MGRVVTQIRGRDFQTPGPVFDFLLMLQKLGPLFGKLNRVFEKLGLEF